MVTLDFKIVDGLCFAFCPSFLLWKKLIQTVKREFWPQIKINKHATLIKDEVAQYN